jgi:N-acetylglucosamine kinase-like BadF-type ATPase
MISAAEAPPAAVLAIDGGNSKTDVALVGADGSVLASVRGPGASRQDYGTDGAMRRLGDLVRVAATQAGLRAPLPGAPIATHVSACLAGADLPEEEAELTEALRGQGWAESAVALNDTFAVLRAGVQGAGATPPWGVAVTCGAGINCVAVAPDGRVARYLALGSLTGDWGGGVGVSQAIMWHVMRAADGRGPATDLAAAVAGHFGLPSVTDVAIAVHKGQLGEADLLPLSAVLFAVAATGDAVARALVTRQADEICLMAVTAMRRLGLASGDTPVVLGGGLVEANDPTLLAAISERLAADAPGAVPLVVDIPPVAGAALLGLDHVDCGLGAERQLRSAYRAARRDGPVSPASG